jgi:hypothetical protein
MCVERLGDFLPPLLQVQKLEAVTPRPRHLAPGAERPAPEPVFKAVEFSKAVPEAIPGPAEVKRADINKNVKRLRAAFETMRNHVNLFNECLTFFDPDKEDITKNEYIRELMHICEIMQVRHNCRHPS